MTGALSAALARKGLLPVRDRGRVLTDFGLPLADGGQRISAIVVLRDRGELFGSVASATCCAGLGLHRRGPPGRDAGQLRPGNAGSNTAAERVNLIDRSIA